MQAYHIKLWFCYHPYSKKHFFFSWNIEQTFPIYDQYRKGTREIVYRLLGLSCTIIRFYVLQMQAEVQFIRHCSLCAQPFQAKKTQAKCPTCGKLLDHCHIIIIIVILIIIIITSTILGGTGGIGEKLAFQPSLTLSSTGTVTHVPALDLPLWLPKRQRSAKDPHRL